MLSNHKVLALIEDVLDPKGKYTFMMKLKKGANIVDIGCGNKAYKIYAAQRPDISYNGIDVKVGYYDDKEYYNSPQITFLDPANFGAEINKIEKKFDTVLSIHNIEHCENPDEVWHAMLNKMELGGLLYLRTPCEKSVNFPSRKGTLNFYDDKTHVTPVDIETLLNKTNKEQYQIVYFNKEYHGTLLSRVIGFFVDPISNMRGRVISKFTWHYWGFETLLILKKIK
jgi:cyclopropane fatty-acyl-phospholipid synthase-like methyltransferase